METGAKRKLNRTSEKGASREWSNMERSSRARQDVDTMSLACVSDSQKLPFVRVLDPFSRLKVPCVDGGNSADDNRGVNGNNRLLFK